MRKRRILSLLLAVAVTVTMLVAVPLTASAAGTSEFVVQTDTTGAENADLFSDENIVVTVKNHAINLETNYHYNYGAGHPDAKASIQVRAQSAPTANDQYGTVFHDTSKDTYSSTLALNVKNPGKLTLYYRRQNDQGATDTTQFTAGDSKDVKVSKAGTNAKIDGEMTNVSKSAENSYVYQTFTLEKGDYAIWATGSTIRLNAIRFEPSQVFTVNPSEVAVKVGGTADVDINISGYDDKTAENVTWSITEEYNGKIKVDNKPGENKATVSVLEGAEDMAGHTATITATLEGTEATAELKVEILTDDPNALVPVYESTTWTFDDVTLTAPDSVPAVKFINDRNNMKLYFGHGTDDLSVKSSKATVKDNQEVKNGLYFAGGLQKSFGFTEEGEFNNKETANRIIEICPGVAGVVTVYASGNNRTLKIRRQGTASDVDLSLPNGEVAHTEIEVEGDKSVYFYSGGSGIYIYAIYFEPAPEFGDKSYDSGYYYNGDDESEANKRGVIRFFQGFAGKNVEDYGFVFINGDTADSTNYYANKISGGEKDFSTESLEGFYGTVKDIVISEPATIYAKAFVTINGATFFGERIDGKVSGESAYVNEPAE